MSSNKKTSEKELKNIEKKSKLPITLGLLVIAGIAAGGVWYLLKNKTQETATKEPGCNATIKAGNAKTPTETYQKLFDAVKRKDKSAIRSMMSKDSMGLAEMQAGKTNKEVDSVLENAFTSTVFTDKLPQMRDERVKCQFGAVEVYDNSKQMWQDLPFVIEEGAWKLAVGNLFAGTFKSPGTGQAMKEREQANLSRPPQITQPNNANTNVKPTIIDPTKGGKVPIPMKPMPNQPPANK